ncbi:hypothetical protein ACFOY2_18920 [Nonomuraea purpurea]|uniref:MaoC-like domain-containing protein n=1 Tax=Nonomuraea purpurea TaxID=1849276 RepID=A0ABV8GAG7_9ACTN
MTITSPALPGAGKKEARYELVEIPEPLGPVRVVLDEAKIRSYAFSQDDYGSWYFGPSPFGGPVAHPLALANDLLFLFYDKYDGNTAQGLHTHERLDFHNPAFAGEQVTVTGAYVEKYERRGNGYVVLEAEARGEDGRLLVSHRGVEIMRVVAGNVVGRGSATPGGRRVGGQARADLPVAARAAHGLERLAPLPPLAKRFTQDQMNVFSWAGQHYSNVHTSIRRAADSGLDRTIIQAQQQTGLITRAMTEFFGASWFTTGRLDLRFVAPAYCGDTLTVRGAVLEESDGRLELEVWVDKDGGGRTALGWASAAIDGGAERPEQVL